MIIGFINAPLLFSLLVLTACGSAQDQAARDTDSGELVAEPNAVPVPPPTSSATPLATTRPTLLATVSCAAEVGASQADRRVAICRAVSPATHPPCNTANSCALIEDEIARSCALFDDGDSPKHCGPAPTSMEAAVDVVRRYYSALNAHDYVTAWTQWGGGGRSGQSFAAFRAGFARTRSTKVTIGKVEPGSGAAGSIYQPVPVTVEATLDDGTRQTFSGSYVVRRVNGVDGATASQLRWHIGSAQLRSLPPS